MKKLFVVCLAVLLTGCGNRKAVDRTKKPSCWATSTDAGRKAYEQGRCGEAEKFFNIAIAIQENTQNTPGAEHPQVAVALNIFAAYAEAADFDPT